MKIFSFCVNKRVYTFLSSNPHFVHFIFQITFNQHKSLKSFFSQFLLCSRECFAPFLYPPPIPLLQYPAVVCYVLCAPHVMLHYISMFVSRCVFVMFDKIYICPDVYIQYVVEPCFIWFSIFMP